MYLNVTPALGNTIFIVFLSSGADRLRGDMKAAATVTVAVAVAAYS